MARVRSYVRRSKHGKRVTVRAHSRGSGAHLGKPGSGRLEKASKAMRSTSTNSRATAKKRSAARAVRTGGGGGVGAKRVRAARSASLAHAERKQGGPSKVIGRGGRKHRRSPVAKFRF